MGVGVAAGRAGELGERERRAQLEAAGLLGLRDGDRGEEGVFRGGGVGGVVFEEDFAADAMDLGVEIAEAAAVGHRDRAVDQRQSGSEVAAFGFQRGERPFE